MSRGDLSRVACLSLVVPLTRAASSVLLSPATTVVKQRLVQEIRVIEYAGLVAHFYKLKKNK